MARCCCTFMWTSFQLCEAVQLMCLLLYIAGVLNSYNKGNNPCDVEALSQGVQTKFHCWNIKKQDDTYGDLSFESECFFCQTGEYINKIWFLNIKVALSQLFCTEHNDYCLVMTVAQYHITCKSYKPITYIQMYCKML